MNKKRLLIFTFFYTFFILLIPIFSLIKNIITISFDLYIKTALEPIILSSYMTTISMGFFASIINTSFGFIVAWILTRYNFIGKKVINIFIDLPFALPTAVAGLGLVTVYSDQGLIGFFLKKLGIQVIFTKFGILIAMIFVSFPFVIRTIQPVLEEMEKETEKVAWSLGASPTKTFKKIIFPSILPALLTGFTLTFSRAIGEYGSIVIISANLSFKDLITSVLIFQALEQYDSIGATIVATGLLIISLILLLSINFFQSWNSKISP